MLSNALWIKASILIITIIVLQLLSIVLIVQQAILLWIINIHGLLSLLLALGVDSLYVLSLLLVKLLHQIQVHLCFWNFFSCSLLLLFSINSHSLNSFNSTLSMANNGSIFCIGIIGSKSLILMILLGTFQLPVISLM